MKDCENIERLKMAADKGDAMALLNLGALKYEAGEYEEARELYEKSAAMGNPQAMVNLGYVHYYGRECEVDYGKAFQWFSKAALVSFDPPMPEAFYKLGDMYRWGKYVERDDYAAVTLYFRAFVAAGRSGNFDEVEHRWDDQLLAADAAQRLGDCLRHGIGAVVNLEEAIKFYTIAVEGFTRKTELGDVFAPKLLEKAKKSLDECRKEARSQTEGK